MGSEAETVQKAWAQLAEPPAALDAPETEASKEPEQPIQPRESRDVLLDLYNTVRSIALAAGLDPSRAIEALWEVDNILGSVGRA